MARNACQIKKGNKAEEENEIQGAIGSMLDLRTHVCTYPDCGTANLDISACTSDKATFTVTLQSNCDHLQMGNRTSAAVKGCDGTG